jgi:hypothetical protein
MGLVCVIVVLLSLSLRPVFAVDTNDVVVFQSEKRPGAVIFVDECLTRGITNSMSFADLRAWATNVLGHYQQTRDTTIPKSDIIDSLQKHTPSCRFSYASATNDFFTIGPDLEPPTVSFFQGNSGSVEAVSIRWYIYGIIVGPESFSPTWEHAPWYHRKLSDGIYLWHGYK